MQKSGVIINPAAGRGSGKGDALATALRGNSKVEVKILQKFQDLQPALDELAAAEVTDLFISSGDGTIQAIVTQIAERRKFKQQPRLCVLSHGTTNLTGIDLGFARRNILAQAAFIANPSPEQTKLRHTIKVINPRGEGPRHGFTFGAGAAALATRHTQTELNDKGRKGQRAALRMMMGTLAQSLLKKPDPKDSKRIDKPYPMNVAINGNHFCTGDQLMFIATTLEKQFFNTRPFWGGKNGPIRATALAYPPPNLVRWLLPIMYGSETRKVPDGALSKSGHSFTISCEESFVMDGEFFEGPTTGPLQVEAGPEFEFITA